MQLDPAKQSLLNQIQSSLIALPGVAAVVLGGSWALGRAHAGSDLDIGIYYRPASPFSIDALRGIAASIAIPGSSPVVTDFYGWGEWVNGGAWIETPLGEVDFIYRNLDQLEQVLTEGESGQWRVDYDQQPPFGFRSIVYFGELHAAHLLADPTGNRASLKQRIAGYPPALRQRILTDSLWGAEFSLFLCRKYAASGNVLNVTATLTRIAHFLVQALYALNQTYYMSDKHALANLDDFPLQPSRFTARLSSILASAGNHPAALSHSVLLLESLWKETLALAPDLYQPRFTL